MKRCLKRQKNVITESSAKNSNSCHVFLRPDQIEQEINLMLDMIAEVYKTFGFNDFWVRISTRNPKSYIGDLKIWEDSEAILTNLITKRGWKHDIGAGEAAFYGPKLDFIFKDVIGRDWQLSTIQLDMNLPQRFELEYIDENSEKQRPVVIHRAILGSTERFLGILIEHFAGKFPVWLAPVQATILPVSEKFADYGKKTYDALIAAGIRAELSEANESLGKRIREAEMMKVPYIIVVGEKEEGGGTVNVRDRKGGEKRDCARGIRQKDRRRDKREDSLKSRAWQKNRNSSLIVGPPRAERPRSRSRSRKNSAARSFPPTPDRSIAAWISAPLSPPRTNAARSPIILSILKIPMRITPWRTISAMPSRDQRYHCARQSSPARRRHRILHARSRGKFGYPKNCGTSRNCAPADRKRYRGDGLDAVFKKLVALDPEAAGVVDPKNPRRVVRALEVASQRANRSPRSARKAHHSLTRSCLGSIRRRRYCAIALTGALTR
jgi:hypothetical protein